ncbi:MAG: aminopeptidase [Vicinamibacterales bacterium]|nr:aminopeptidase [Vicinamibacterales bacterium]
MDFARKLELYAELAVKVALNVQPGQRLLIIGPLANGGASLEAAPLARQIARAAYRAGSPLVETIWGDEELVLARYKHAPRDSFGEFSRWFPRALEQHVEAGHAIVSLSANDPDLLKEESPELVSAVQQASSRDMRPFREHISRNQTNWAVVAGATPGWAKKIFPDVTPQEATSKLWDAIWRMSRVDHPDPVAAWEGHLASLAARADYLNGKQYDALKYSGPGTDLTLGLPRGHLWVSGRTTSRNGIPFTANLPTEEVFSIAHKDRVDGVVRSSKPLSYGGTLIDGFTLWFEKGRVTKVAADRNVDMLQRLVDTDEGARRLGEVALVPHSSPIAQSGLLFYNTLFDENAASHVALGNAYKFTLSGGNEMNEDAFARAGGNRSAVHVDFMIGSGELDVDGVMADGTAEPLMRKGEWATSSLG